MTTEDRNAMFHAGDTVTIREWEDMLIEFDGDSDGILCNLFFSDKMRHLCGLSFTIDHIDVDGRVYPISSDNHLFIKDNPPGGIWLISTDMIVPADTVVKDVDFSAAQDALSGLLGAE